MKFVVLISPFLNIFGKSLFLIKKKKKPMNRLNLQVWFSELQNHLESLLNPDCSLSSLHFLMQLAGLGRAENPPL